MPYWKCFLWTAAIVAGGFCVGGVISWLDTHAPDWVFVAFIVVLSTAILAIVPWLYFK